jgi:5-methylcytosine-specific restriction endonuclease McrA
MNSHSDSLLGFQPGQPAQKVDSELKSALKIKDAAHQCSLDWFGEILHRKLYIELGFSSINQYARQELGFGNSKIGDYIKLTNKLGKLPNLKASMSKGEVGYTKGRMIVQVADETTEKDWSDFAKANSRPKVEEAVKLAKMKAKDDAARQPSLLPPVKRKTPAAVVPVRVNLELTPTQFARYEKVWEQIRKQGNASSEKVEALLEIMESFLDAGSQNVSPRGVNSRPTAQIHIHHCPECESSTVQTRKGELEVGKTEFERYQCDCQTSTPDSRNATSIPPATRRRILAKARHKCQTPGCNHTSFIEIHHVIPRSKGGTNDECNLRVYCSACHSRIHAHGANLMVKSPSATYSWNISTNLGKFPSASSYSSGLLHG